MSKPSQWITGRLSVEGMQRAREAADQQLAKHPDKDRGDLREGDEGMPRAEKIFQGCAAEEFLVEHLGVTADEIPRVYKSRWSSRRAGNFELAITNNEIREKHSRRWVLVTGRAPDFSTQGWCWASEAKHLGEYRENAKRSAWFISWRKLHDPGALTTTQAPG